MKEGKIVFTRQELLKYANAPGAFERPEGMPYIPNVTIPLTNPPIRDSQAGTCQTNVTVEALKQALEMVDSHSQDTKEQGNSRS